MKKYTVVGEYWDNEQTYVEHVEVEGGPAAAEKAAQKMAAEHLSREDDEPYDDYETNPPLKIHSVFEGHHQDLVCTI
jgi:hypothetical protein